MDIKPRRQGMIYEYQHGHYFMYVTEWQEQQKVGGGVARRHREIEIYYAKARVVRGSDDPIWNSTDPNKFDMALQRFFDDPASFEKTSEAGELPDPPPPPENEILKEGTSKRVKESEYFGSQP